MSPPAEAPGQEEGNARRASGETRRRGGTGGTPAAHRRGRAAGSSPRSSAGRRQGAEQPGAVEGREEADRPDGRVLQVNELPAAVRSAAGIQDLGPRIQPRAADAGRQDQREDPSGRAGPVPGLRLEEIVPDGVIFGYRGYRFRVDLDEAKERDTLFERMRTTRQDGRHTKTRRAARAIPLEARLGRGWAARSPLL